MKIAIVSFYSSLLERGAENWAYEISENLSKSHQIKTYQQKDSNILVDWNKPYSEGKLKRLFFIDYWSIAIAKFTLNILPVLWKEDFDIYIPVNGGWQARIIRILTWIKGSKMVIVGHSGKGWDDRSNLWVFPDVYIALTGEAKKWAKKANPFIRIEQIPNGVDLEKFNNKGSKIETKLNTPIILCVGALVKSKRIDLVIKAVSLLKDASLLVVGKGELKTELMNLGQKLLGDRFYLTDYPYQKMPDVYRVADIFSLSSWENEAFPLVYLEAMASGLPVVATNDEIRSEIIGQAGILIDPQNSEAYAKAIEEALEYNWSNQPREQAKKFSWEKISKKYEEVFSQL